MPLMVKTLNNQMSAYNTSNKFPKYGYRMKYSASSDLWMVMKFSYGTYKVSILFLQADSKSMSAK